MVTTITKTIKAAGGGDYTSLSAWDLVQRGNIVTRDTIEVADIYGGGSVGAVAISDANWTVDSTHYIHIKAATGEGHNGIYNASKAYIESPANTDGITANNVGYMHIGPGISMNPHGSGNGAIALYNVHGKTAVIDSIIICHSRVAWLSAGIVLGNTSAPFEATDHIVKNCAIYANGGAPYVDRGIMAQGCNVKVQNCTITMGNASGCLCVFNGGGGHTTTITSENNYLRPTGTGVCYFVSAGAINKGTNDATSNTEAVTASLRSIAYSTANFNNVTSGTENLHLVTGSALLLKGKELSDVTTDFEGTSRVGLIYDIGADQFSDVPMCWNYTARYKGSLKLFKASGCGPFPKNLKVPSNVDTSTGRMVDDGELIDPRRYTITM